MRCWLNYKQKFNLRFVMLKFNHPRNNSDIFLSYFSCFEWEEIMIF